MKLEDFKQCLKDIGIPWQMYLDNCNDDYLKVINFYKNPQTILHTSILWSRSKQGYNFWRQTYYILQEYWVKKHEL